MSIFIVFLYALVVVISLLLIGIVLIQPAKSGGMGAAFGGIGESVFGAKAGSHLTKATVVMTTLFFVLTLVLATLIGRGKWKTEKDWGKKAEAESAQKQRAEVESAQDRPAVDNGEKPDAKPQTKPVTKPAAKPQAKPAAKPQPPAAGK